ncbi:PH domain-containing protein [Pseudidiomarina homiensis]|uniref:PH domain-containing protein n=1 Tax=Pseudidiomarina homiensis TaxID=364198 RepID=UPI00215A7488|nr:PH domain-containing protein [Pseudidiomarina homiensis]
MDNFDEYRRLTNAQNWRAISAMNQVVHDTFGTRKELKALPDYLELDEVVFAFTSGLMHQTVTSNASDMGVNTWLAVLTNERFLFLDAALLSGAIDTQSVRHDRVSAVSASQGWMFGKIIIDLGARLITIDNCTKDSVKAMASLANKWLRQSATHKVDPAPKANANDPLDLLERLARLKTQGTLTEQEFQAAKAKILAKL